MRFSEEFAPGAGSGGAGSFDTRSSSAAGSSSASSSGTNSSQAGASDSWSADPFSEVFQGRLWEGIEDLAPAGPWGVVEIAPTSVLESLTDVVDALERLNELQCWADAQKARLVDRIRELYELETPFDLDGEASPQAQADQDEYVAMLAAEEVGSLLRLPSGSAKTLIEQSRLLVNRHERTLTSMESGKLSWRHATTVVDECLGVPAESVARFEEDLVETAEQSTVAKLTRQARGLREILHPEAAPVRKARAVTERRVALEPGSDGMAWLSAYLPAEQACGIYNRIDAGARGLQSPDEPRTLTQLRADVLTDLLTHTCTGTTDTGTGFRGINATVHLTVPALTLLNHLPGAGDETGSETGSSMPGTRCNERPTRAAHSSVAGNGTAASTVAGGDEPPTAGDGGTHTADEDSTTRAPRNYAVLEGYGPIDPDTAAGLAAHARSFTRILTHPETGEALSIGRATYRPPKHLQDWVRARDKTCRHPGCDRTATATEIDHTIPWHEGGNTDHNNLACLCRKHHTLKTKKHWHYAQPEPGTITATSPAGKSYTTQPPPF